MPARKPRSKFFTIEPPSNGQNRKLVLHDGRSFDAYEDEIREINDILWDMLHFPDRPPLLTALQKAPAYSGAATLFLAFIGAIFSSFVRTQHPNLLAFLQGIGVAAIAGFICTVVLMITNVTIAFRNRGTPRIFWLSSARVERCATQALCEHFSDEAISHTQKKTKWERLYFLTGYGVFATVALIFVNPLAATVVENVAKNASQYASLVAMAFILLVAIVIAFSNPLLDLARCTYVLELAIEQRAKRKPRDRIVVSDNNSVAHPTNAEQSAAPGGHPAIEPFGSTANIRLPYS